MLMATAACAQDTRKVTEPVIPPSCFVLSAKLNAVDGKTLAEADEDKLDTNRIQKAIDACPKGQSVELKADGRLICGPASRCGWMPRPSCSDREMRGSTKSVRAVAAR